MEKCDEQLEWWDGLLLFFWHPGAKRAVTTSQPTNRRNPDMKRRVLGIDLANDCFQVLVSLGDAALCERHRFNRAQFTEFMARSPASWVLFEVRGTAHDWARTCAASGRQVELCRPGMSDPTSAATRTIAVMPVSSSKRAV